MEDYQEDYQEEYQDIDTAGGYTEDAGIRDSGAPASGTDGNGTGGADSGQELLERLDALIETLTPETDSETGGTLPADSPESGTPAAEPSGTELQVLETLESINGTLAAIRSDESAYFGKTLLMQEESLEVRKQLTGRVEFTAVLLIAVGFFVALSCGNRFAGTFFGRMKGE